MTNELLAEIALLKEENQRLKGILDSLKEQIASIKKNLKSENHDYETGYLCALSAVEGMLAEVEE